MSYSWIIDLQPGTPGARPFEAPTPGNTWTAPTPGASFSEAGTPTEPPQTYGTLIFDLYVRLLHYMMCIVLVYLAGPWIGLIVLKRAPFSQASSILLLLISSSFCSCSKPLSARNTWRSSNDTRRSIIPSWHSWRAAYDTWKWRIGSHFPCNW